MKILDTVGTNLHSTIFILKRIPIINCLLKHFYLHSTIFILKLHTLLMLNHFLPHLHSTIFILKHHINLSQASLYNWFTFYYIYIKTSSRSLKKPSALWFTFYYIYIKTKKHQKQHWPLANLHSTIFILKHTLAIWLSAFLLIYILLYLY